jgi:hypothetical protein
VKYLFLYFTIFAHFLRVTLNPTGESHRRWLSFVQRFAHGFHGPGDGADIACSAGFDQNKSQPFKKIGVEFGQVHLK